MQTKLSPWLSLIALFALFTFQAAAQAQAPAASAVTQQPGRIQAKRVVGEVTVKDIATGVVKNLATDDVIAQGTIVNTGVNSSVVLLFSNGASINLAFSSELNIETFTQGSFDASYEPSKSPDEPSVSTTNIKLTRGELVGNVKKLKRGGAVESKFTVGTPVGAAGIRGTTFKITYRPSGDGRTFTFTLTTLEGRVEVVVASGNVTAPPLAVTDNKEIVITNVEVNVTTNQVTATTATGQTASVTAVQTTVVDAPVSNVQQVAVVAQQLVQAITNVIFTPPPPVPNSTNPPPTNNQGTPPDPNQPGSPGTSTQQQRITNGP